MAGGLPLTSFLDWVANTGPEFLSGADRIVNNVSRRSFILGKFLRGKEGSRILQGGSKIQETLYLSANRTFQTFQRNEDVSWTNPQKDVVQQYDWKFTLDHMSWDEAEYLLQTSGMSGDALATKYKDMAYSKQQRMWESVVDGWESLLWQTPDGNYANMEGGGAEPLSIPVFINDGISTTGGTSFDEWATIGGIDQTVLTNWDNGRVSYTRDGTYTAPATGGAAGEIDNVGTGLFAAFDEISIDINYQQPGYKDQYFEDESLGNPTIIATSKRGQQDIMMLHRAANDMLIQPQDAAYPLPRWNGIAIKDVAALDTAALYSGDQSGDAGTAEAENGSFTTTTTSSVGPRFYFMNCNYLQMVFHRAKYFDVGKTKEPENKVGVYVQPVETWGNMICTSRRNQGLVYPRMSA